MDRVTWLQERRKGIGGSDVAAIAGLSKWKSPVEVYLEKVGEAPEEEQSEAAYWGTILEDIMAREFQLMTGLKVQRRNAILQHSEYPWMIANLDRVIVDKERGRGVLECKTASEWLRSEWEGDKVPDAYMIQVQHYLAVTGYQYAYIAALIGGNKFIYKEIKRDEEVINYLIKIERDFWQLVESRTPPEMDGSEASSKLLDMLYPEAEKGAEIRLPMEAEDLIAEYEQARAEEQAAAERKEAVANKLKALLGTNEIGVVGDRKVTWKMVTSSRLDTKTLKTECPDIYAKYARESQTRRFMIS
ncbi:MAG: hypothetical protein HPY71_01470 [Firmicutes bacterium]|nr:hypothetical protein [Bacillota bacterium]